MRPVAIIGIGKTNFGAFPDRDLRSLAVEAGQNCLADAHVNPSQVEAFYLGNFAGPSFVGQNHLAPYIAGAMGVTGVPATRFEAACASSGSAFFHAVSATAAVLIVPLDRASEFTDKPAKVLGIAQTSDQVALDQKDDITTFQAVASAGQKAYKMASLSPRDIDFAELHDCFTIAEIIAMEDL